MRPLSIPTNSEQAKILWMGNVEPWMTPQFIRELFDDVVDKIRRVKMIYRPSKTNPEESVPVGFCFVEFDSPQTASDVLSRYRGKKMGDRLPGRIYKLNYAGIPAPTTKSGNNNSKQHKMPFYAPSDNLGSAPRLSTTNDSYNQQFNYFRQNQNYAPPQPFMPSFIPAPVPAFDNNCCVEYPVLSSVGAPSNPFDDSDSNQSGEEDVSSNSYSVDGYRSSFQGLLNESGKSKTAANPNVAWEASQNHLSSDKKSFSHILPGFNQPMDNPIYHVQPKGSSVPYDENFAKTISISQQKKRAIPPFYQNTTVFVGNLPYSVTDEYLVTFFSRFGQVVRVRIRLCPNDYRCAFITFCFVEETQRCIEACQGLILDGRTVKVVLSYNSCI